MSDNSASGLLPCHIRLAAACAGTHSMSDQEVKRDQRIRYRLRPNCQQAHQLSRRRASPGLRPLAELAIYFGEAVVSLSTFAIATFLFYAVVAPAQTADWMQQRQ